MPEDGFPLPGSSYKELCKIIAGYSESDGPSSPSEISKLTGIHETQVSRSNKFLVATGIVQGGQKKAPTERGHALGRAIHFDQADVIREGWWKVYSDTDFFKKIVSSVRIRKGMEESSLLSHIAFTSGSAKSGNAMAGAGAIVEILRIVGALEGRGTVVATNIESDADAQTSSLALIPKQEESKTARQEPPQSEEEHGPRSSAYSLLTITLNISCTPDQLDGLGRRLRVLREEFDSPNGLNVELQAAEGKDSATDQE